MEGSRQDVVIPFWRALRGLQAFRRRDLSGGSRKHVFPDGDLEKLTLRVEALKAKAAAN
ncbi:hypothetical protein [Pelagibius sp.]|uniref:hypothetical protein n=1 Tax=Pelagibius sp. TaxID=1931238 RepID=UPI003BABB705